MFEIVSCAVISPSRIFRFCDLWIYHKIKKTAQFLKELTNFRNCRRFRRVSWRHRNVHSVKERLFLSLKNGMNSFEFSSCPIYNSYIGKTNRKRNESVLLVWAKDRLSVRAALGDTVKKVVEFTAESITSLSDPERSNQIQRRILLKLQTSEQTPLMWKPCETLFNNHKSPPFTMDLT